MAKVTGATSQPDPRRGRTLDGVLGNQPVRAFLRRAWRDGRLPQALLLTGPPGMGKSTLAWALAREIVAEGGDPATHPRALKVARNVHPDIIELSGSPRSGQIVVDEVEAMEDRIATMPMESPRKIIVIEPAERMNDSTANRILKILEEPSASVLFVLISPEPNRLLTTIRSRCTTLELRPVPTEELLRWLNETEQVPPDRARLAATLAEGRPGRALELIREGALEKRGEILLALALLMREGFAAVFVVAERFLTQADPAAGFKTAMMLLRDALALKLRGEGILNEDLHAELAAFAEPRSSRGLLAAAECFERAAAEAPFFYAAQARAHFAECTLIEIGRLLKS